jgi:hypothetical protein
VRDNNWGCTSQSFSHCFTCLENVWELPQCKINVK